VYEKPFQLPHFAVLPYPEEAELARSWAAELAWERQDEKKRLQRRPLGVESKAGWEGKLKILVKMRDCQVLSCPEEAGLASYWPLESVGSNRMKKTASTEVGGRALGLGQHAKTEVLDYVKRIERLGLTVTVEPVPEAA